MPLVIKAQGKVDALVAQVLHELFTLLGNPLCCRGVLEAFYLLLLHFTPSPFRMVKAYSELADSHVDLARVFDSHTGIAHTRWATHGSPNSINSHPQVQIGLSFGLLFCCCACCVGISFGVVQLMAAYVM